MALHTSPKQSSKDPAKDLASVVAALRSSKIKLDIDWDEFMKLDGAPTKQAAQMRIYRLGKSLGVEITGSGGAGRRKPKTEPIPPKTADKRKSAAARSMEDEEEDESEEDELQESPLKKTKSEKPMSLKTEPKDNIADRKGGGDYGERV